MGAQSLSSFVDERVICACWSVAAQQGSGTLLSGGCQRVRRTRPGKGLCLDVVQPPHGFRLSSRVERIRVWSGSRTSQTREPSGVMSPRSLEVRSVSYLVATRKRYACARGW